MFPKWRDVVQDTLFNSLALTFLVDLDNKILARRISRKKIYCLACVVVTVLSLAGMAATTFVVQKDCYMPDILQQSIHFHTYKTWSDL